MAKISNEKYAIVCSNAEMQIVKKMGVQEKNIYNISFANELFRRMTAGDILCVASIGSFAYGGYDLFCKMQQLSNHGIEFQSGNERYLNFSVIKPLSVVCGEALRNFAVREYELIQWIQAGTVSSQVKNQLIKRIQWETINDIILVFGNNGIKRKAIK